MAIEVLLGYPHSFRHDLESFYYVLLWIGARRAWKRNPPPNSQFTRWYTGTFNDMAMAKQSQKDRNASWFNRLLDEFPPESGDITGLCTELRNNLISNQDGPFIGSPQRAEDLYEAIIDAFDGAIKRLGTIIVPLHSNDGKS